MWKSWVLFLLVSILSSAHGFGFRGFYYKGFEEPVVKSGRTLEEKWIQQPLDHFNVRNNETWLMRFYENNEFFNQTGPIFIMLGGEWEISTGYLQTGLMYENAKIHGSMMYYTEHRYYGKSRPVPDTSAENLLYLNAEQALADVAFFIEAKKKELNVIDVPVIVFGGSYSGNMAAWAKMKYPHLVQGSLASSAPVRAKADFFEYYDVVRNSLSTYDENCATYVGEAFSSVEEMLASDWADPELFKEDFNLCNTPNIASSSELGWILHSLAEIFAGTVQYNKVEANGKTSIADVCDKLDANQANSTPYQRLAAVFREKNSEDCTDLSYDKFLSNYQNTSWESEATESFMRLWYYQSCTEFGYFQTTDSRRSIFGTLFPLDFFVQICKDLYGENYDSHTLDAGIQRTNIMYGADLPDVKNVIFTNGDVDPWHPLSVLWNLNDKTPAIFIKGASHSEDLNAEKSTDTDDLKRARERISSIIYGWLRSSGTVYGRSSLLAELSRSLFSATRALPSLLHLPVQTQ